MSSPDASSKRGSIIRLLSILTVSQSPANARRPHSGQAALQGFAAPRRHRAGKLERQVNDGDQRRDHRSGRNLKLQTCVTRVAGIAQTGIIPGVIPHSGTFCLVYASSPAQGECVLDASGHMASLRHRVRLLSFKAATSDKYVSMARCD